MSEDKFNWSKYLYHVNRKLERRNNRTPEEVIEHEKKIIESQRRKRRRQFEKFFGIDYESNRNTD